MQAEDKMKFAALICNVYAFYQKDSSDFAISVWWEAMKPFDFVAVADALNRHCVNPDSGQFMAKPADVIKMLSGSSQDSAMVAWSKVDKALRQVGTYASAVFDDPIIHRVLHDMGGWVALGTKTEHEWPFVAKEFENRYRGYRIRSETPEYPRIMIGIAQAQNSQEGKESQPPVLIGDGVRARQVLAGGTNQVLVGFERMRPDDVALLGAPEGVSA